MFHRREFGKRGNTAAVPVFSPTPRNPAFPERSLTMPIRRPEYEEMIEERVQAEEEARREERRYWIITLLVCMAWCVLGAVVTGAGFALYLKPEDAKLLIDAGQGIAAAGVLATVTYAGYHRRKSGLE